jgi:hypothetical protein
VLEGGYFWPGENRFTAVRLPPVRCPAPSVSQRCHGRAR